MTESDYIAQWFDPIPLDKYAELVRASVPSKITDCPDDYSIGTPEITVACGPNVRFLATHEDNSNNYRGSILLVIKESGVQPCINYYIGPSQKSDNVSLSSGEFTSTLVYEEAGYYFWRYEIKLQLADHEQKVKYEINSEHKPHFQFYLPSQTQSMNVMSYSCNGFSLSVNTSAFNGSLWYDVLRKHQSLSYHVMIGGGDQIYSDSIKTTSKEFKEWLEHKHIHSTRKLTPEMTQSFANYYLHHYLRWFGKGYWVGTNGKTIQACLPIALSCIPQINIFDDHDIIDGFGSYADITMRQEIFEGVGNSAFKYYMLFQHHTPYDESPSVEPSWIPGTRPGPYIKQISRSIYARLGSEIGFVGVDCRTERTKYCVVNTETYSAVFKRVQSEIDSAQGQIKHLLVLLGIPICYPRLVWVEKLMESGLLAPVKYLARKGVIAKSLVNEFDGSIELLDDLNDHWCAGAHKHERNELMGKFVKLGADNNVRITILSGDVHLCCMSRFKTKIHRHHLFETSRIDDENKKILLNPENDPRLIVNLISSAIVNVPPPNGMALVLQKRAKIHRYDSKTDEDVIPMFYQDPNGEHRSNHLFMNKRNYSDLIPLKNISTEKRKLLYPNMNEGDLVYPGLSNSLELVDVKEINKLNGTTVGYPYSEDSLVATLHVEVDNKNVDSETRGYELFIPKLTGNFDLKDIGIK